MGPLTLGLSWNLLGACELAVRSLALALLGVGLRPTPAQGRPGSLSGSQAWGERAQAAPQAQAAGSRTLT